MLHRWGERAQGVLGPQAPWPVGGRPIDGPPFWIQTLTITRPCVRAHVRNHRASGFRVGLLKLTLAELSSTLQYYGVRHGSTNSPIAQDSIGLAVSGSAQQESVGGSIRERHCCVTPRTVPRTSAICESETYAGVNE